LWWSIITLTTVGYGDVSPVTPLGKFLASFVALAGIGLVAMPTGIMAAAFSEAMQNRRRNDEVDGN
jgi:voltage-gated potassium channel